MSVNGKELSSDFYSAGKLYWEKIDASVDGMLGGYTRITNVDVHTSKRFLNNYFMSFEKKKMVKGTQSKDERVTRALDCGSGIGRITKHLLFDYFDTVDLVEQNQKFLDETRNYMGDDKWKRIGHMYCVGLQDFVPKDNVKYDCIWCQWVTGHLTDDDFVMFLVRCKSALRYPNSVIIVKDNTTSSDDSDFDTKDSSVVRPLWLMKEIFKRAELTLICERKQYKMPKGIYPIRMFALR